MRESTTTSARDSCSSHRTGRRVEPAVLQHHIYTVAGAFRRHPRLFDRGEQLEDEHGAIGKTPGPEFLHGLVVRIDVVQAAPRLVEGGLWTDESALHVLPLAVASRKAHVVGIGRARHLPSPQKAQRERKRSGHCPTERPTVGLNVLHDIDSCYRPPGTTRQLWFGSRR